MENFRLIGEPALCDAHGLEAVVSQAAADGVAVFAFEDPARFSIAGNDGVKLEYPDATRLWNAWSGTDVETRRKWSAEIPQPLYLKPPHITPGKRAPLVRP